jgi:hypothetical protein
MVTAGQLAGVSMGMGRSKASGQPPTRGLVDAEHLLRLLIRTSDGGFGRADNLDAGRALHPADQTLGEGTVLHQRVGFAAHAARLLLGDADDPGFECEHNCLHSVPQAKLVEDVSDVSLGGVLGDDEIRGDFRV